MRSDKEINEVLEKCFEAEENGSAYSGMSYEDGVKAAIDWMSGYTDEKPFDD